MKRVVLFGPALAGKTTLMSSAASKWSSPLTRFEMLSREFVPQFGLGVARAHQIAHHVARGTAVEIVTMGGSVWSFESWEDFGIGSSVALVLDPQEPRVDAGRKHAEAVTQFFPMAPRACVIWTKRDLVDADLFARTSHAILHDLPGNNWKKFETSLSDEAARLEAISWICADESER